MPSVPFPLTPLPCPSEDQFESREGDRVGSRPLHFSLFFSSCLKLHESPFEQCPPESLSWYSFATATPAISFSFCRGPLGGFVISPRIDVPVLNFLVRASAHHIFGREHLGSSSISTVSCVFDAKVDINGCESLSLILYKSPRLPSSGIFFIDTNFSYRILTHCPEA